MSGVNYEVRVRAVSPIGAGEFSNATTSMSITECYSCSMTLHQINIVEETMYFNKT